MKTELLSPVGNMEMFYQAVHNGADAVYLGGKMFGARAYSNNFNNEEMIKVIDYAHVYGVKVYVTVNTIIFNNEVEQFLDYVEFLYKNGVDAVIMQDIGMIDMVHKCFPTLEIHASTQCHNHNEEGINFLKKLGVSRVVLDREMSLDEVNKLNIDIEKEIFIHGALCICYSGCCLFSSLNGGRSGNRGSCVGSCRLPYKLMKNNDMVDLDYQYLLSTKELMTISHFKEIMDSNINCLKIEGRMKSPYYVGYVTRIYRMLIDKYYNNEKLFVSEDDILKIKKLFNRKFTSGYLFKDDIINMESPNHLGVPLGYVLSFDKHKIRIKLSDNLNMQDGIRFKNSDKGMIINKLYNEKGLLVNSLRKGEVAVIDNKVNLKNEDLVLKTLDYLLNRDLENYVSKKIDIKYFVKAVVGKKLEISISDGVRNIKVCGNLVERADSSRVSKDIIYKKLAKLGNTPYRCVCIDYDIDDDIFIRMSEINDIRRELVLRLTEERKCNNRKVVINRVKVMEEVSCKNNNIKFSFYATSEEQVCALIELNVDSIYVSDYNLYLKYKDKGNLYYKLSRIIKYFPNFKNEKIVASELGAIYKYSLDNEVICDYYLNVTNNASINLLNSLGVRKFVLSPEVSFAHINNLNTNNLEVIIYGYLEAMVMKYCPFRYIFNNCNNCKNDKNKYYILDRFNNKYRILHDDCLTTILNFKKLNNINMIDDYVFKGVCNFGIVLLDESKNEIISLVRELNLTRS